MKIRNITKTLGTAAAVTAIIAFSAIPSSAWGWGRGNGDCGGRGGYGGMGYGYHHGYGAMGYGWSGTTDYLKDELKLTDTQVKKIEKINSEFREKTYNSISREKSLELRLEKIKKIKSVLNDEQKKKFDGLDNRKSRRYRGYRGR